MPFRRPTTTPTPDEIFDEWVHKLKHSELLALLYIVRRTFGFRDRYGEIKDGDRISLRQFHEGIVTRDGRRLDHGCGVRNKTSITEALKRLEELKLIRVRRSESKEKGNETTWYALAFVGDGIDDSDSRVARTSNDSGGGDGTDTDDAPAAPTVNAEPPPKRGYAKRTGGGTQNVPGGYEMLTPPSGRNVPGGVRAAHSQQTVETTNSNRQTDRSNRSRADICAHVTHGPLDSTDSTALQHRHDEQRRNGSHVVDADDRANIIGRRIATLSEEFGDDAPRASVTRVANLRGEQAFTDAALLDIIEEAAAITRSQARTIRKRGRDGRTLRMPYFLRTLEGLLRPERDPSSGRASPRPEGMTDAGEHWPHDPAGHVLPRPVVETDAVWRAVLEELRTMLTAENYNTWLADTRAIARGDGVLRVGAPNAFHRDWLENKLNDRVLAVVRRLDYDRLGVADSQVERVEYIVSP